MIQTEAQRQFYLGVAGIRLWYAREPLPGAAPSPEFYFPEPEDAVEQAIANAVPVGEGAASIVAPSSAPSKPKSNQQGLQRIASLQALMASKEEVQGRASQEAPAPKPAVVADSRSVGGERVDEPIEAPQVAPDTAPTLNMGVLTGSRYMLIASVSDEASLRLQETLASNILKSLGDSLAQPVEWLRWPVFNNRLVPGGSTADLASVVRHVLRDAADRNIVSIGQAMGSDGVIGSGWLSDVIERLPDVDFEHSLVELASDPSLKRALWQRLKPLACI